jgi:hypothetical protein
MDLSIARSMWTPDLTVQTPACLEFSSTNSFDYNVFKIALLVPSHLLTRINRLTIALKLLLVALQWLPYRQ